MSEFIHCPLNLNADEAVRIELQGTQSNVFLLDSGSFSAFKSGRSFHYTGGLALKTRVFLQPPHAGQWHVVVQPPAGGRIRASFHVVAA